MGESNAGGATCGAASRSKHGASTPTAPTARRAGYQHGSQQRLKTVPRPTFSLANKRGLHARDATDMKPRCRAATLNRCDERSSVHRSCQLRASASCCRAASYGLLRHLWSVSRHLPSTLLARSGVTVRVMAIAHMMFLKRRWT